MIIYEGKNIIDYSHKLSKMHKSALPNTVRFTLNDLAKDVKTKTLQEESKEQFEVRKPTFFKRYSGFQQAGGYNIARMKSTVGMVKGADSKSVASTQIGEQQTAGTVENKSYLPSENMRTSKGLVKKKYLDEIKKRPIKTNGKNYAKNWAKAKKSGRTLLVVKNGRGVVVVSTRKLKRKTNNLQTRLIASYKKNRNIDLTTKKPFLNNAAIKSGQKMEMFYIRNAKRQIERLR